MESAMLLRPTSLLMCQSRVCRIHNHLGPATSRLALVCWMVVKVHEKDLWVKDMWWQAARVLLSRRGTRGLGSVSKPLPCQWFNLITSYIPSKGLFLICKYLFFVSAIDLEANATSWHALTAAQEYCPQPIARGISSDLDCHATWCAHNIQIIINVQYAGAALW